MSDLPRSRTARQARSRRGERGFTLAEMLVAMIILSVVLTGIVALFNFNTRVAKSQMSLSEMQQSLRVGQSGMVRTVRMAGRGGLPVMRLASAGGYAGMFLPQGPALGVANDVAAGTTLGGSATAAVVAGSDVLTVRGVINTPLYQVNPAGGGNIVGAAAAGGGAIVIERIGPTGVPQDLHPLLAAITEGRSEPLLLVSAGSDEVHAIVELTGGAGDQNQVTLNFTINGGSHAAAYLALSPDGVFPVGLRTVGAVGILEEYRYYVRDTAPAPRLSRARFWPGTEVAYLDNNANLAVDIADNILDLQVALGIDRNNDLVLTDNNDSNDEWMFNDAADDPAPAFWNDALYFVRISTLARTGRLDPKYVAPPLVAIEDRRYDEPATPAAADRMDRSYRRRQLQTLVDLRNLT